MAISQVPHAGDMYCQNISNESSCRELTKHVQPPIDPSQDGELGLVISQLQAPAHSLQPRRRLLCFCEIRSHRFCRSSRLLQVPPADAPHDTAPQALARQSQCTAPVTGWRCSANCLYSNSCLAATPPHVKSFTGARALAVKAVFAIDPVHLAPCNPLHNGK